MSFGEKGGVLSQQKASIIELNVSNRGQNKGLLDYLGGVLYHSIFLRCQIKYITRHMVLKWVAPRIWCVEKKIFYEYKKVFFLSDANMNRYI